MLETGLTHTSSLTVTEALTAKAMFGRHARVGYAGHDGADGERRNVGRCPRTARRKHHRRRTHRVITPEAYAIRS